MRVTVVLGVSCGVRHTTVVPGRLSSALLVHVQGMRLLMRMEYLILTQTRDDTAQRILRDRALDAAPPSSRVGKSQALPPTGHPGHRILGQYSRHRYVQSSSVASAPPSSASRAGASLLNSSSCSSSAAACIEI